MWRYIVKRLLWLIVVAVSTAFVIFTIMYFVPGDPATIALLATATFEEKEAFREVVRGELQGKGERRGA